MPPHAIDTAAPPQTKSTKGLLSFLMTAQADPSRHWIGQATVRTLGDTRSSDVRRSARRPVWE